MPKSSQQGPFGDLVTLSVSRDVYDCVVHHRAAMVNALGHNVTLRDATEALILAGFDYDDPRLVRGDREGTK